MFTKTHWTLFDKICQNDLQIITTGVIYNHLSAEKLEKGLIIKSSHFINTNFHRKNEPYFRYLADDEIVIISRKSGALTILQEVGSSNGTEWILEPQNDKIQMSWCDLIQSLAEFANNLHNTKEKI